MENTFVKLLKVSSVKHIQNFEILIFNDGSTDDTKKVTERLIAKYPNYSIRCINQKNSGQPAISRNRGILEANGKYILCLDADDMLPPTMLEKCLNILEQDKYRHRLHRQTGFRWS